MLMIFYVKVCIYNIFFWIHFEDERELIENQAIGFFSKFKSSSKIGRVTVRAYGQRFSTSFDEHNIFSKFKPNARSQAPN